MKTMKIMQAQQAEHLHKKDKNSTVDSAELRGVRRRQMSAEALTDVWHPPAPQFISSFGQGPLLM